VTKDLSVNVSGGGRPIGVGIGLAIASAVAFGATIPMLGWAGTGVGPFVTASLLYAGASVAAVLQKAVVRESGSGFVPCSFPTLLVMAGAGAVVAPTLFAWGLQLTGPVTGGLLLNLEAVWTVVLARIVFGEFLGRRVLIALTLMLIGGALLAIQGKGGLEFSVVGVIAVVGASLAWAIDNTASRRLAELRPLTVVATKGAFGAVLTLSLALIFHESLPKAWQVAALLAAGATGYGASLRLYLMAQRRIGAARTASVFALAPFIGAALGLFAVPTHLTWAVGAAGVLFVAGVALHISERHAHRHRHEGTEHDHAHSHDDGHHSHGHAEPVIGEHAHRHRHEPLEHEHDHGPDVHHGHDH
jgi:drug/metabolite transporter (DMT)-like permease